MSIIIAIKNKNGVFVGADKQATSWKNKIGGVDKIHRAKICNTVMGCVGYLRDCNILQLQDNWVDEIDIINKTNIDIKYIIEKVVPKLFVLYKKYNRVHTANDIHKLLSTFMFCTNNRIFSIDGDGSVVENNDFATIGCGEELVTGFLNTIDIKNLTDEEVKELIKKAVKVACKDDVFIGEEIDFIKV